MASPVARADPLTLNPNLPGATTAVDLGSSEAPAGDIDGDGVVDSARRQDKSCAGLEIRFRDRPDWRPRGGFLISDAGGRCPGEIWQPAGDVNGDSRADLLITIRPRNSTDGPRNLYVVFGKPDASAVDLAQLGAGGFEIRVPARTFGSELGAVHGDFTGDGHDDLLLAARGDSGLAARLVPGRADASAVDLADSTAAPRVVAPGGLRLDNLAFTGDMTGDGRAELAASVGRNAPSEGRTWVVFGRPPSGDIQVDQESESFPVDSAGLPSDAGDTNGDGRADLAIMNGSSSGDVVVFGKADHAPVVTAAGAEFAGFRIALPSCQRYYSPAATAIGDLNGDELSDITVACAVVFGKQGRETVDTGSANAGAFLVQERGFGPSLLKPLGDVTGDSRPDLLAPEYPETGLVPAPAALSSPAPISSTQPSADVLCLLAAGCEGTLRLSTVAREACANRDVPASTDVGTAQFALGPRQLAAVVPTVTDDARVLAGCALGLPVRERLTVGEHFNEHDAELIPPEPVPASNWRVRTAAVGLPDPMDLRVWFDGRGTPFGVFLGGTGNRIAWRSFRGLGRSQKLGLNSAGADLLPGRRLLVAGSRPARRGHQGAYFGVLRAGRRLGRLRPLDPGAYLEGVVSLATNRNGLGLTAFPRRVSRRGASRIVGRFLTARGLRRGSLPLRHSGLAFGADTALNARGDGVIAWCTDPYVAVVTVRSGHAFGRVQDLENNEEGACGPSQAASGPRRRFAWIWTDWIDPYNDDGEIYPTEVKVAVGRAGGRFKVQQVDSSVLDSTQGAPVSVLFRASHVIAGYSSYDALTGHDRVVIRDLTTRRKRWVSPPQSDAHFASMDVRPDGALAVAWTSENYVEGMANGTYASFARRGLDFGPPERLQARSPRTVVEEPPALRFSPAGRARAMWFSRARARPSRAYLAVRAG